MTPWTAACQASLSSTISHSLLKFMSMRSMMLSNHLIFCHSLLPSVFPSVRVFSNELACHIRKACLPRNHFILIHFQSHSHTTAKWITMCDLEHSFWQTFSIAPYFTENNVWTSLTYKVQCWMWPAQHYTFTGSPILHLPPILDLSLLHLIPITSLLSVPQTHCTFLPSGLCTTISFSFSLVSLLG